MNPESTSGKQFLKEMIGHACRPQIDDVKKCVIHCHAHVKAQYKTSLSEALSVESSLHLKHNLNEYINAGVIARTIHYNTLFYI